MQDEKIARDEVEWLVFWGILVPVGGGDEKLETKTCGAGGRLRTTRVRNSKMEAGINKTVQKKVFLVPVAGIRGDLFGQYRQRLSYPKIRT